MRVIITGASGLIGSQLESFLLSKGNSVKRLVRKKNPLSKNEAFWDPVNGYLDASEIDGFDAIINLAGESLSEGRWSEEKKQRILESRIQGTQLLSQKIAELPHPPKVLINASAIGFYGDRGEEELTEKSASGSKSFVAKVCRDWEAATSGVLQAGIRVVCLRIGVVLSSKGGALAKMIPPFKMGVGGIIGSGEQYISWIAINDLVEVIYHVLTCEEIKGPVNAVSPNPVQNKDFTRILGDVLHRPSLFPMPAFAARLAFGEMADELILASTRVYPLELQKTGFQFKYPELRQALEGVLAQSS